MANKGIAERLRTLLIRVSLVVVLVLLVVSDSHWRGSGSLLTLLFPLGIFLAAIGAVGRLWCSVYISGYKTNRLITSGPYAMCRNPLYFFSLIGVVGVALVTETLAIPAVLFAGFVFYYPSVVLGEESRLAEIHGQDYQDYCRQTPRFFPSLTALTEPEEYMVRPAIIRKSFIDAIWFVWGVGVIELIKALHDTGVLPVYLMIY
jgi:protein-S-isoprenylcysteine O-methyltransferase Ste14